MTYELLYLRAVMEWLHQSGKYEPLQFEAIYQDWKENISQDRPSELPAPYADWDFVPPEDTSNDHAPTTTP